MKSDFIKIHIKDKKFVNINLRGIEKYFNYDDLAFLKKKYKLEDWYHRWKDSCKNKGKKKMMIV